MTITIEDSREVYKGWTSLSVVTLRDGATRFTREIEDHGHAVGVLPYDPDRGVALLVEQPRVPVLVGGGPARMLEAPAGLIDDGEDEETCARREAFEETGVALHALERIAQVWTSPGVSTERITLFLARYAAADRTGEGGGLAAENENIVVVEHGLRALSALADSGGLLDLKTLYLVTALRLRQPDLFG